ncbi:hypothetical protein ZWY2020_034557 [Hordeum vulgare]|nr:hypothetical protein ZWY2020_034557 [Hordeum vulgare]
MATRPSSLAPLTATPGRALVLLPQHVCASCYGRLLLHPLTAFPPAALRPPSSACSCISCCFASAGGCGCYLVLLLLQLLAPVGRAPPAAAPTRAPPCRASTASDHRCWPPPLPRASRGVAPSAATPIAPKRASVIPPARPAHPAPI